jgi:DNA-binding MarR family transcriptional regulator
MPDSAPTIPAITTLFAAPLSASQHDAWLEVTAPGSEPRRFLLEYVANLTLSRVRALLDDVERGDPAAPLLVVYSRSSPQAREALREHGVSHAGEDGRLFVSAPPLFVDRDKLFAAPGTKDWRLGLDVSDKARNPYADRSSRVVRWLLLNRDEPVTASELAEAVDLSLATVTRVLAALDETAVINRTDAGTTSRGRRVRLERPGEALEAFGAAWERRRIREVTWNIGARSVEDAVEQVQAAGIGPAWALGGLAGAAHVTRVVEPGQALIWTTEAGVHALADALFPEPGPPRRGAMRVAQAPDAWVLSLVESPDGIPIADPVQLWLDCVNEGERALEAAEAIQDRMHW